MAKRYKEKIRIGTLVKGGNGAVDYIREILPHGFESFALTFWASVDGVDLKRHAREVNEALAGSGATISCVGCFGNPLERDAAAKGTRDGLRKLIDAAHVFGCDLVTGFARRLVDTPIDQCMNRYKQVWGPLAKRAADKGVRLAFENCPMGGDWNRGTYNIAHNPAAWELMFDALPAKNVGLQWEPCHQMVQLIDPIPQLRKYVGKIFNVHGKDATIRWDAIREHGIGSPHTFAFHRTPGFGDSNWSDIITELRMGGFAGSIDIEGWHDPVYRDEMEMMGQVRGLNYLKACRGGQFVPNPA